MKYRYIVFILTHKRARRQKTLKLLERVGYTGDWLLIIDDQDPELEEYKSLYPGHVYVFSKQKIRPRVQLCDNFNDMQAVVFARNIVFDVAQELGFPYFIMLDDDYTKLNIYTSSAARLSATGVLIWGNVEKLFDIAFDFLVETNAACVAFAQSGDFIGGVDAGFLRNPNSWRKLMNFYFCRTDRPFQFIGRLNEDVNAYLLHGSQGKLFLTIPWIWIAQCRTQAQKGGLTEPYKRVGTYVKSFYPVIVSPSCVRIEQLRVMGRLHHHISWQNAVPKILPGETKKPLPNTSKKRNFVSQKQSEDA